MACALLARASQFREAGNEEYFTSAVREAARVAEQTLEVSGQTFGAPERAALQLSFDADVGRDAAVTAGLEKASEACSSIGRWPDRG